MDSCRHQGQPPQQGEDGEQQQQEQPSQEQLDDMVLQVHREGGQVAVHANGDAAVAAAIAARCRRKATR